MIFFIDSCFLKENFNNQVINNIILNLNNKLFNLKLQRNRIKIEKIFNKKQKLKKFLIEKLKQKQINKYFIFRQKLNQYFFFKYLVKVFFKKKKLKYNVILILNHIWLL